MNIFKIRKDNRKETLTNGIKGSIIRNEGDMWATGFQKSVTRLFKTLAHLIAKTFRTFSTNLQRPSGKEKLMNALKLLAAAAVFALLVACGGGGGGSPAAPSTPVTPGTPVVPVVATGSVSSATGCTIPNGASTCSALLSWTTANAETPTMKVGAAIVSSQAIGTNFATTIGFGPLAVVLSDGTKVLDASKSVTGSCAAGSTIASGVCAPVQACTATAPLNATHNICVTPANTVKVFTANNLPAGCTSWTQQCWRDARNIVKWQETPATMTGLNGRPILNAYFKNAAGLWNILQFYADDLSPTGADISGGFSAEIDWVYGNTEGVAFHDNTNGLCGQFSWTKAPGNNWGSRPFACF